MKQKISKFKPIEIQKSYILFNITLLVIISLVIKGAGFFKEGLFARAFGVSGEVDQFYFAFIMINFISTIVSGSIVSTFIPFYFEKSKKLERARFIVFSFIFTIVVSVFFIGLLIFGLNIVDLEEDFKWYFYVFSPIILLSCLSGLSSAMLNTRRIFMIPTLFTLFIPLVPIYPLLIQNSPNLPDIAFYTMLGYLLCCVFALFFIGFKSERIPLWKMNWNFEKLFLLGKKFFISFFVLIGGYLFIPGVELISQFVVNANYLGGVAQLSYAGKITSGVYSVLAFSLATVLFPEYAKLYSEKSFKKMYNYFTGHSFIILFGLLVFAMVSSFFSYEIISLIFFGGQFMESDILVVSSLQTIIFFYIPFLILVTLNSRILSSMKKNFELLFLNVFFLFFHAAICFYFGPRSLQLIPLLTVISVFSYWLVSTWMIRKLLKKEQSGHELPQKLNIAFLVHSLAVGGAERQLTQTAIGLAEKGHSITIYIFYGGYSLEKELIHKNIQIHDLKKWGHWENIIVFIKLCYQVTKQTPDVFYSFLTISNIYAGILYFFCPSVRIVWGIRNSNYEKFGNLLSRLSFKLEGLLSGLPHAIVCNSYAGLDEITRKGYPKNRSMVIPNGIDTKRFCPDQQIRDSVREELGVGKDEVLIGMVARWDPVKDHLTFFRGIKKLDQKINGFKILCVGNGDQSYLKKLQIQAKEQGIHQLTTWVDRNFDPCQYYRAIDILVSTSMSEGFSNVIGEGMATNVFQIVTNVGDSKIIVGQEGSVIEPCQEELLSERLIQVIQEGCYRKSQARQRILDNYSVEKMTLKNEQTFFRILDASLC